MKMTGLDHITVNVKDLDRSKAFYGDVLGLKEAGSVQMGDHTLTYYELPQGVRLELIDYEAKEEPKDIKETDTGTYRHFCLVAAQLDEVYSTCRNKGVSIRKPLPMWTSWDAGPCLLQIRTVSRLKSYKGDGYGIFSWN